MTKQTLLDAYDVIQKTLVSLQEISSVQNSEFGEIVIANPFLAKELTHSAMLAKRTLHHIEDALTYVE